MLTPFLQQKHTSPIEALKAIVEHLESEYKSVNFIFNMASYKNCVLGCLNNSASWIHEEEQILNEFFNVDVEYQDHISYFASTSFIYYSDEDWEIIRLFTSRTNRFYQGQIDKNDWLKIAKQVIESKSN